MVSLPAASVCMFALAQADADGEPLAGGVAVVSFCGAQATRLARVADATTTRTPRARLGVCIGSPGGVRLARAPGNQVIRRRTSPGRRSEVFWDTRQPGGTGPRG